MDDIVDCPNCSYFHSNGNGNYINLEAGNFCPKCGTELSKEDMKNFDSIKEQAEWEYEQMDNNQN